MDRRHGRTLWGRQLRTCHNHFKLERGISQRSRLWACFVQGSDRKLVPRDLGGHDLGSFYADIFVSCAAEDRKGNAAHLPALVIEVLSAHVGQEFTHKKEAYLGSAQLLEYLIVDSTRRYVVRYAWQTTANGGRRLLTAEYRHGPVAMSTLGLSAIFDTIYAGTNVSSILHPILPYDEDEAEILRD